MVIQSSLTSWNRTGVAGKMHSLPGSRMVQILILHEHRAPCLHATDGITGTVSVKSEKNLILPTSSADECAGGN